MNITPTATNSTCVIDNPKYVEDQQQDTSIQSLSEESSDEEVEEFTQGPLGNKFMDTKQFLELMKVPHVFLNEIPTGRKDGMYFFLGNSEGIPRHQHKQHTRPKTAPGLGGIKGLGNLDTE